MVEVIISVALLSGTVLTLFKVKDNTYYFLSKINNTAIEKSLTSLFLPYKKEQENKNRMLVEIFDFKNEVIKQRFKTVKVKNIINIDEIEEISSKNNKINFQVKEISIDSFDYKKIFYSFTLN